MSNPYRTRTCNDLRLSDAGKTERLAGWIHNKRDLGGVLFIDLRDHYGITQIVIPPTAAFQDALSHLPKETVISVHGQVRARPDGTVNADLATGEVELDVAGYDKLGSCEPLPMNVFPEDHTPEETRLKYRFLDLRRSRLHQTVMLRAQVISSIRRRMIELGFQEFQTPIPRARAISSSPRAFIPANSTRCRRRRSSSSSSSWSAASTAISRLRPASATRTAAPTARPASSTSSTWK
jgi:aspartyl-tRNA synthetase